MTTVEAAPAATPKPRPKRRRSGRAVARSAVMPILGIIIALFVAAPLYWMIISSFENPVDLSAHPSVLPHKLTTVNYHTAFVNFHFQRYLLNSLVIALAATVIVLALGIFAGYAMARLPMRGRFTIMVTLLMISLFPAIAVVVPLYVVFRNLGLLNSYWGLIIAYSAFNLPFAIWILRNFFLGIPKEMEEVARVDGAGPVRTVLRIIVPQALPGIFTAGVFCFCACWTEFLMSLLFNQEDSVRTMPVGMASFGVEHVTPYGTLFAASVVAVVPIAIIVLVFRKWVVSGLTSGAVKG